MKLKRFTTIFWILAILLALPLAAAAAPVGKISSLEGSVDLTAGSTVRDVKLGDPVNAGDILRAKSRSRAEVTFLDGNILRLAENTRIRITDYQAGEPKTTTLDLFRGKVQNIVAKLFGRDKYEVHTPTAICGVRGTDFIAFFQNGVSGFVPKDGTIYGYNRTMPQEVKTVTSGQAIMVMAASQPPTIQPATSMEVEKHVMDTAPTEKKEESKKEEAPPKETAAAPSGTSETAAGETTAAPPTSDNGAAVTIAAVVEATATITATTQVAAQTAAVQQVVPEPAPAPQPPPLPPAPPAAAMIAEVYFAGARGTMAVGTLDDATGIGNLGLSMQYTTPYPEAPATEVGYLAKQDMSDGSTYAGGYLVGAPGSWMGATSGIYAKGGRLGVLLGYLAGDYDSTKGTLTASGSLTRTPTLMDIGTAYTGTLYDGLAGYLPGITGVTVGESGPSYVSAGKALLTSENTLVTMTDSHFLEAWATTDIGDGAGFTADTARRGSWTAKYGYDSGNSFLIGDVTGTETNPGNLRLSGRNLLYIDPYVMGYANLEYWTKIDAGTGVSSAGAGTIEAAPLAFGGYWGWNMGSVGALACIYYNNAGWGEHIGDEWGFIGSLSAPWTAPAPITAAGTYIMDSGFGGKNAYLWNTPISKRGYMSSDGDYYSNPLFTDGDYYGFTAGHIGTFAQTEGGAWERGAKGAAAAVYVKDGKAGFLTTFAPDSSSGGLTGGYYPDPTGEAGFWRLDGTLTATPVETRTTISEFSAQEGHGHVCATYSDGSSSINGSGYLGTFSLNVYDSAREANYTLPWGVFSLEMDGDGTETLPGFSAASKNPADLSGKDIRIGGSSYSYGPYTGAYVVAAFISTGGSEQGWWLGNVKNTVWTQPVNGSGEFTGTVTGTFLSTSSMGTFTGPFYGIYDEVTAGAGTGTWIGDAVGTYSGTRLAFNGNISGSLKYYTPADVVAASPASFNSAGSTYGLMGATTNPLTGPAAVTLMGSYYTDATLYREPALMYGSGWYLSGRMGIDTAATDDDGSHNGYIVGIWNGGLIEQARILGLYNGPGGKAGYLYGKVAGGYFSDLEMWQASGTLSIAEQPGVTTTLDVLTDLNLNKNTFSGAAKATISDAAFTADLVEGAMLGLIDQNPGWGIWNMGMGGTYSGTLPASVQAKIGGSLLYNGSTDGYWVGDLNVAWGSPENRLDATLTGGRFLTDLFMGDLVTGPYGGIMGNYSSPVDGSGTWQAAGVGTYSNVKPLDLSGYAYGMLRSFTPAGGDTAATFTYRNWAYGLIGAADDRLLTQPGTPVELRMMGESYAMNTGLSGPFVLEGQAEATTGKLTEATTDDGVAQIVYGGIAKSGKLEGAKAVGIYVAANGTSGYLSADLSGGYYDLPMSGYGGYYNIWEASSTNLTAGAGTATKATPDNIYSSLVDGMFTGGYAGYSGSTTSPYGGIAGTGDASAFISQIVAGNTMGLSDQTWGIWYMSAGGTHPGSVPASFTARAGGDFNPVAYATGPGGYWLGNLAMTADSANSLFTGTFSGRILTDTFLADISTNRGGISGSFDASTWQAAGVGSYENQETLAFSTKLDGQISKMMGGTIRNTQYTSLYNIPSTVTSVDYNFNAGSNRYKTVRYDSMYFQDAFGAVNLGYRQEAPEYLKASFDGTQVWRDDLNIWYWPNRSFFIVMSHSPTTRIISRGRAFAPDNRFPNLDLSATTPVGGTAGNHPFFPGTAGNPTSFPADYVIKTSGTWDSSYLWGRGTYVKTTDWTIANANSGEEIGTFNGILGVRGSDPMTLFASSTAASPVNIALMGNYVQSDTYKDIRGTLRFNSGISSYVSTTPGYGGAYYGDIDGYLPDTGSTIPLQGSLYALYVYTPDAATNRAGIIYGNLTEGAASTTAPEIRMWQADGQMYRLADPDLEKDLTVAGENPAGVTAENLAANILTGRGSVEGTAGFYTPTSASDSTLALGMGHGKFTSVKGFNKFGTFFLNHAFMNYYNGTPATATTWESAGWGEFGGYIRGDGSIYRDIGYWYATMDDKSWGNNKLSADFNGRFLTLRKYGTMTGETSGTYSDDGTWGAISQGYWQKSGANGGDLAFASEIKGNTFRLSREDHKSYSGSGTNAGAYYHSWISDPSEKRRHGGSSYNAADNTSTFVRFETQGPSSNTYVKETWTTADGGTTWSYEPVYYADETAYNAALDAIAAAPSGSWTAASSYDDYHFWENHFDGIMGGINTNLWTEKTSPIPLQGTFSWIDNPKPSPSLATGEIMSFNPTVNNADPWSNSTTPILGAYRGNLGFAVDSANSVSGSLMGLYQDPSGNGGVLYSDDISGVIHPAVGAWTAEGNLNLYQLTTTPLSTGTGSFAQTVHTSQREDNFASGAIPTLVISGATTDIRFQRSIDQSLPGENWGIWSNTIGGTYTGPDDQPTSWIETRENQQGPSGGMSSVHVSMSAPVNGIATGTVAGVNARFDETTPDGPQSYTVVMGGNVKGLFDPTTTPKTWMVIAQGGKMETGMFMAKQSAMDDAARANFEKAMKIPSFDVGMANLRGSDTNLSVNMDGIKFFRFQSEASPKIWATGNVYGSYASDPSLGTKVQLQSSGDLKDLTHTFEVKQWNTSTTNWGASIYKGAADTGGTLTRSATDAARTLPAGATPTIPITEMRGGAAGTINTTSKTFGGTAAGTVR